MLQEVDEKKLSKMKHHLHSIIDEWLGNDIPEEGTEDFNRWQSMESELNSIASLTDVVDYLNNQDYDVKEFLEEFGIDYDDIE
ncbi:hypothetical protein [Mariprofundus sp. KV]|uniref:hypothetical protein n=1 Tax=Mariprofundus sp. KV TaxID=2608715 RepID=UPI0015A4C770|nr:hypothetical protein [Mariprofundus sp. KV]NWF37278.1 hypothetical protein [Mariprofundus sp. KV]